MVKGLKAMVDRASTHILAPGGGDSPGAVYLNPDETVVAKGEGTLPRSVCELPESGICGLGSLHVPPAPQH